MSNKSFNEALEESKRAMDAAFKELDNAFLGLGELFPGHNYKKEYKTEIKKKDSMKPDNSKEKMRQDVKNSMEKLVAFNFELRGYKVNYVRKGDILVPKEYLILKERLPALEICPKCNIENPDFLRGQVQSGIRKLFFMPYCAIICHGCHSIIGWEKP